MTLKKVLEVGCERLLSAGIDQAQIETEHMLMHLLGKNRAEVYLSSNKEITLEQEKQFFAWIILKIFKNFFKR